MKDYGFPVYTREQLLKDDKNYGFPVYTRDDLLGKNQEEDLLPLYGRQQGEQTELTSFPEKFVKFWME